MSTSPLLPLPDPATVTEPEMPRLWWVGRGTPFTLAGMAYPRPDFGLDFGRLAAAGVGAVVSLVGPVSYDATPLKVVEFSLQDLADAPAPSDLEHEENEVRAAVEAVRGLLASGTGVVVHCHAGVGRTGTVIGSVLTSLGYAAQDVVDWLAQVQRRRGARGWPESTWQREMLESFAEE